MKKKRNDIPDWKLLQDCGLKGRTGPSSLLKLCQQDLVKRDGILVRPSKIGLAFSVACCNAGFDFSDPWLVNEIERALEAVRRGDVNAKVAIFKRFAAIVQGMRDDAQRIERMCRAMCPVGD
jgi:hypothetical protein